MNAYSSEWSRLQQADAVRRARRQAERESVDAQLVANATPETLRQRRVNVIDEMWRKGKLTAEQRRAASEICEIWTSITRGLFAKTQEYEPRIKGAANTDWRIGLVRAYHDHYIPWRNEAGAILVRPRQSVADMVFMVAVDNYGFQQVADSLNMHRLTAIRTVRESLYRYAEHAGWTNKDENHAIRA